MSTRHILCAVLLVCMFLGLFSAVVAQPASAMSSSQEEDYLKEWNNQIRREKFDLVLPQAMRKNKVDMWIHVMREGTDTGTQKTLVRWDENL